MAFSASAPALGQGQAARRVAPAPQPVLQHAGQQVVALRSDGHDAAARGAAVCHSLATRQLCAPSTSGLHPSLGATPVQMRHAMRNPLTHPRQRGGLGEIGQPSWPRPVQVQVASLPISQIADIEDSGPSTSRSLNVQERASQLFGQLRDGHVPPSAQCNKLLRRMLSSGACTWAQTQRLYKELRKHQVSLEDSTLEVLASFAVKAGHSAEAASLLRQLAAQADICDQRLATQVISKLLSSRQRGLKNREIAYELWAVLRSRNQRLDAVAYRTGIDACVENGHIQEALGILNKMLAAKVQPGRGAYNRLMKYYAERGDMDSARRIFKQLRQYLEAKYGPGTPPDIVSYNTLLAGFVRQQDMVMARAVLDKARRDGVSLDSWTYATYIHGLAMEGRLDEAEGALDDMQLQGLTPTEHCYGALISACLRSRQSARAKQMLDRMLAAGMQPGLPIYNMLIKGYCYDNDMPAASQLLLDLRAAGLQPDEVTYGTLIHSAVRSSDPQVALECLSQMQMEGLVPDVAVYTSLMKLFKNLEQHEQAERFYQQAVALHNVGSDVVALNCLVSVRVAAGQMTAAEDAARLAVIAAQRQGLPPPSEAFAELIKGYEQRKELRPALSAFRFFLKAGGKPSRKLCNRVVRMCLQAGDLQAANQVVRALKLVRAVVDTSLYEQWFREAQSRAERSGPGADRSMERMKWWLGLPNNYYSGEWK